MKVTVKIQRIVLFAALFGLQSPLFAQEESLPQVEGDSGHATGSPEGTAPSTVLSEPSAPLPEVSVVQTFGGGKAAPAAKPAAKKAKTAEPASAKTEEKKPVSVKLKSNAFVSEDELKTVGKITHSGETKMELTTGDHVYLEFSEGRKVKVGDRFFVIEKVKKIDDPDSIFGSLGWLIRKRAVLKVASIPKNTVDAVIESSEDGVRRGDELIPYESPIRTVTPHTTAKTIAGKIIEAEAQQYLISNNDFVYLNVGKKQGVDDGLQLVAVKRGDGIFQEDDENLPDVVVGNLLVIETEENTSTAYVTSLRDSLSVGDRVRNIAD